jgi:hypothetical protein
MIQALASLSAAALLMAAAMGLMALGLRHLGRGGGLGAAVRALVPMALNIAVLVLGIKILAQQAWFRPVFAAFGVLVPIAVLAARKGKHGTITD